MWRREAFVDGHEARAFCGVAGASGVSCLFMKAPALWTMMLGFVEQMREKGGLLIHVMNSMGGMRFARSFNFGVGEDAIE